MAVLHELTQGLEHHQQGNLFEARRCYLRALSDPLKRADALHLLGVLEFQRGAFKGGIRFMRAAISRSPKRAAYWYNLSLCLDADGDLSAALAAVVQALELVPDHIESLRHRVLLAAKLKLPAEMLDAANRLIAAGDDADATRVVRAKALIQLSMFDDARVFLDQSIDAYPKCVELYRVRARLHRERGFEDLAVLDDRFILVLKPGDYAASVNVAAALMNLGQFVEAKQLLFDTLATGHNGAEAHANLGVCLLREFDLLGALASFDRAIKQDPLLPEAWSNRGVTLQELGEFDAAMESFNRALAINPHSADSHFNRALLLLLIGEYASAWADYEWRWQRGDMAAVRLPPLRRWDGIETIQGKRLVVFAEQGLGDSIQMLPFVTHLSSYKPALVILVVPQALVRLLMCLQGLYVVVEQYDHAQRADLMVTMMSLPGLLNPTLSKLPLSVGYISALKKADLPPLDLDRIASPVMGLVWRGSPAHVNDRQRSIDLAELVRFLPARFRYVSLQQRHRDDDLETLSRHDIANCASFLSDMADTCEFVAKLDVVISVDTSVAHLAAAMGKPTWILLPWIPDWRWGLKGEHSAWYPSVRLFRQTKRGCWEHPLRAMQHALSSWGNPQATPPA